MIIITVFICIMKNFIFLLWGFVASALFFSVGCTNKSSELSDTLLSDTTMSDTMGLDTLSDIIEEEKLPATADELFDDFFFNFAVSKKIQKDRILFPLKVYSKGKEKSIESDKWKIEHFFMSQGYYTLIFHKASQIRLVKDTTVHDVTVERINVKRNLVTQWHFIRKRGLWKMDNIKYLSVSEYNDADFIKFYNRFVTDTAFQQRSLAESVSFTGPDPEDDFSTMTGSIIPEQWPMFAPWMPSGVLYNIVYGDKPYTNTNTRYFYIRGIANGLQTDLLFTKKGRSWKLEKVNT